MCAHHVLRLNIETGRGLSNFGHLCMLGLVLLIITLWSGTCVCGGVNPNCSKNQVFAVFGAHCVFGARQVFETTFGHMQNFWQKQIFQNVLYFL